MPGLSYTHRKGGNPINTELMHLQRGATPFDDCAMDKLRRMSLLTEDYSANEPVIVAIANLYAGLFFDHLCDNNESYRDVVAVCRSLTEKAQSSNVRQTLLQISMEYDAMKLQLPEPIWWISGNPKALKPFIKAFAERLAELLLMEGSP